MEDNDVSGYNSNETIRNKAIEIYPLLNGLTWFEIEKVLDRVKGIYTGYPIFAPHLPLEQSEKVSQE